MDNQAQNKQAYLSFKLDNELFAVSAFKVLEVLEKQHITKVPKVPEYVMGIINFRGEVLPVIDTRKKFRMPARDEKSKFVIIVFDLKIGNDSLVLGAVADTVKDVIELESKDIKEVPKMGLNYNSDFILGMIHTDSGFIMLLDVDRVFSEEDVKLFLDDKTIVAEPEK